MTVINLNLSDELQQFLTGEMQAGQFESPAAYFEALLRRVKNAQGKLESQLIEGLDSGEAVPLDEQHWGRIRAEVQRRLANG